MRVILMLGTRSRVNADRLKEQRDSLDIEAFGTVKEMMESTTQRNVSFDRVVVSTATLHDETTMRVLHKFLREMHPRATVVLMYQNNKGEDIARKFNGIFNSPLYTDMVIKTNSVTLLEESATLGVDVIREKYSIRKYGEIDEDILEDSYPEKTDNEMEPIKVDCPMLVLPQSIKQRKRTGVLGLKKLTKQEMQIIQTNLKLITDYLRYLQELANQPENPVRYVLPQKERRSMSDPVEDYKTEMEVLSNITNPHEVQNKKQSNFVDTSTFTPLELGYYGFSIKFDGRPMMFRLGVRVTQVYNSQS